VPVVFFGAASCFGAAGFLARGFLTASTGVAGIDATIASVALVSTTVAGVSTLYGTSG
jgi:hypothetical protein